MFLSLEESELGNGCLYGEFREGRLCSRGDKLPGLLNLVPVSKYFQHVSSEVGPGPATGEAERTRSWYLGSFPTGGKDFLVEKENPEINVFSLRAAVIRGIV